MWHNMKLYERVYENRLKNIVSISEEQFNFVKGKSTTQCYFCARNHTEKDSKAYTVCSLILEKNTYNEVPREEQYISVLYIAA